MPIKIQDASPLNVIIMSQLKRFTHFVSQLGQKCFRPKHSSGKRRKKVVVCHRLYYIIYIDIYISCAGNFGTSAARRENNSKEICIYVYVDIAYLYKY